MRVAINAWFLDQPGTGTGQYLRGLLSAFPAVAPGMQLLLVVPRAHLEISIPSLDVQFWSWPARRWRSDAGKVLFEQAAFPWACRRWGAEVAHVPYWGSAWRPGCPTVVTVHDLIPLLLPAYRGGPLVRLYTALVRASAHRAALVLTDSRASKEAIEANFRLPAERVRSVYLAAGPQFRPEPSAGDASIRARYGVPSGYVLYLAGHDVRKNVAGLLEAFALVGQADSSSHLVIGGRLPETAGRHSWLHGRSPLFDPRPMVSALGLEERVRFIGWVEEDDKPALYRGATCAAFMSRYEGFGLPVLEALACGTPLVASNAASLPELIGDAGFALDAEDVKGTAAAILSCYVDEQLAADLRSRGPQQAAKFTWQQTASQTVEAYEAVRCAS